MISFVNDRSAVILLINVNNNDDEVNNNRNNNNNDNSNKMNIYTGYKLQRSERLLLSTCVLYL